MSDPDFNPDHAQIWTRSSYDHYLPTHQISPKSDQSFLRNPANKQTNKQRDTRRWLQYPAFRGIIIFSTNFKQKFCGNKWLYFLHQAVKQHLFTWLQLFKCRFRPIIHCNVNCVAEECRKFSKILIFFYLKTHYFCKTVEWKSSAIVSIYMVFSAKRKKRKLCLMSFHW